MIKPLLILIACHLFTFSNQAMASEHLWFGVEKTDYSPYYFLDQKQRYQGAARDIFDLFAVTINRTAYYHPMPVPRLFNEFVKGEVDLKFPDNPLWSASLKADVEVFYSEPIFEINETLLVLNQPAEIKVEDIHLVGSILGFSLPGIANNIANKEFENVSSKTVEQLIHMLVSERVQAVYFNEVVALNRANKMYPHKRLIRHSKYPPFRYAYHLSTIKHPELIEAFNAFLINYADQIEEIRQRYGL